MHSNTLYRWEQSAGLEHGCGRCGTKQNDPKARQSCYGVHTEPCPRYHQIMFFLGMSHNCYPCTLSKEQHDKRHMTIAELIGEYKNLEDTERLTLLSKRRKIGERQCTNDLGEPLAAASSTGITNIDSMARDRKNQSETPRRNAHFATVHESPGIAQKRALKREGRAERSISKAAKNQRRQAVTVRREDIEKVSRAIHGQDYAVAKFRGNAVASDKTIEDVMTRNAGCIYGIREHRSLRLRSLAAERDLASKSKHLQSSRDDEAGVTNPREEMDNLVAAILTKLGINSASTTLPVKPLATAGFGTPGRGKKSKAVILQRLSTAIAEDIENHESELKQTYQRAAGFWRYANHEILVRLAEHARKVEEMTRRRQRKIAVADKTTQRTKQEKLHK